MFDLWPVVLEGVQWCALAGVFAFAWKAINEEARARRNMVLIARWEAERVRELALRVESLEDDYDLMDN